MTKQEIFDRIGCPEWCYDAQGNQYIIDYNNKDNFEANLSSDTNVEWYYTCPKYPDPAEHYYLKITFDLEGKSLSADMIAFPLG